MDTLDALVCAGLCIGALHYAYTKVMSAPAEALLTPPLCEDVGWIQRMKNSVRSVEVASSEEKPCRVVRW